ncbi:conjugal transfer protein TraD [Dongia soli]|uniref:Conjugal transfer protein TraD n=1 Tax=Dongia soli TaxID=600628 RepID=A0ABU5EGN5_9PROT|nr:conjugal transfer protein TraD [Dongia soli]MDY0885300.1 conjugal transfer protein TraD [Dongia soli]
MTKLDQIVRQIQQIKLREAEITTLEEKNGQRMDSLQREIMQRSLRTSRDRAKASSLAVRLRTRKLLRLGILLEQSGLSDFQCRVLEGALISAWECQDDLKKTKQWRIRGAKILEEMGTSGASTGPADKARNRRWIAAGAVFERAGMMDWDVAVLASILEVIGQNRDNVAARKRWISVLPIEVRLDGTAPLCLMFPKPIGDDLSRELQLLGISFDRKNKIWSGTVDPWHISLRTDHGRYRLMANHRAGGSNAWMDISSLAPAIG